MAKKLENETELGLKRRARKINRELAQAYPYAVPELDFETPFELLVATVLSAQTTDVRVNAITPALFARFPDALAMSQAERAELEQLIRPTGFFRAKTDSLLGLSAALVERFDGEVPAKLDELVKLPGVGRKTANVVLGNAFGVPGITVDTHFGRLARRLKLTEETDPVRVEHEIGALIEKKEWTLFSHRLIFHGRRICHSRRAACGACMLAADCPSFGLEGPADPMEAQKLIKSDDREHLLKMAGM